MGDTVPIQPAPFLADVSGPNGKASPEFVRWFNSVQQATSVIGDNNDAITALQTRANTDEAAISALQTRATADEAKITSNANAVSALQTRATADEANIASNAGAITALQTRASADEANITSNTNAISALQTRATTDETNIQNNTNALNALATVARTGSYNDLSNQPSIPTNTNQLVNGAGFITASGAPVQSVNGLTGAVSLSIPSKTSQLANDSAFITASGAPVQSVNGLTGAVSLSIPAAQVAANLASSSSTGVTGTLPVANGGTGATSAAAALSALGGAALSTSNNFTANNGFGNVASPQAAVNIAAGQSLQIGANTDSYYTTASNNGLQFHRANSTSYVDQSGLGGSLALRCSVSAGGDTTVLTLSPSAATFAKPVIVPSAPPASSSATGTAGSITWDANYLYVCVAANSWRRIALSTF